MRNALAAIMLTACTAKELPTGLDAPDTEPQGQESAHVENLIPLYEQRAVVEELIGETHDILREYIEEVDTHCEDDNNWSMIAPDERMCTSYYPPVGQDLAEGGNIVVEKREKKREEQIKGTMHYIVGQPEDGKGCELSLEDREGKGLVDIQCEDNSQTVYAWDSSKEPPMEEWSTPTLAANSYVVVQPIDHSACEVTLKSSGAVDLLTVQCGRSSQVLYVWSRRNDRTANEWTPSNGTYEKNPAAEKLAQEWFEYR